jgi:hypothetical protein
MAQHQHLTITGGEAIEGGPDAEAQFVAEHLAAGGTVVIQEPIHQGLGGVVPWWGGALLADHAPPLCGDMPPVQGNQPLPGELPQPGIEGDGPADEVLLEGTIGLDECLLNHIGRVETSPQSLIEPKLNHAEQPLPVTAEQALPGAAIARGSAEQQFVGVWSNGWRHQLLHYKFRETDLRSYTISLPRGTAAA